jgi:hypothetical protein
MGISSARPQVAWQTRGRVVSPVSCRCAIWQKGHNGRREPVRRTLYATSVPSSFRSVQIVRVKRLTPRQHSPNSKPAWIVNHRINAILADWPPHGASLRRPNAPGRRHPSRNALRLESSCSDLIRTTVNRHAIVPTRGANKMRRAGGGPPGLIGRARNGKFRLRRTNGLCCWLKKFCSRKAAIARRKFPAPMHTKPTGSDC